MQTTAGNFSFIREDYFDYFVATATLVNWSVERKSYVEETFGPGFRNPAMTAFSRTIDSHISHAPVFAPVIVNKYPHGVILSIVTNPPFTYPPSSDDDCCSQEVQLFTPQEEPSDETILAIKLPEEIMNYVILHGHNQLEEFNLKRWYLDGESLEQFKLPRL